MQGVEYLAPGDVFGEQQLFESKPDGEVLALDPTEVVAVPLDVVKKAARSEPAFTMEFEYIKGGVDVLAAAYLAYDQPMDGWYSSWPKITEEGK